MTFLGAFVGLHDKGHLGTDSLIAKLPVAGQEGLSSWPMC